MDLKTFIRPVADFPKKGILFYDITPLLSEPHALSFCIEQMHQAIQNDVPDGIIGIESRGFIFGSLLAQKLQIPFVPVRKKGNSHTKPLHIHTPSNTEKQRLKSTRTRSRVNNAC